MVRGAEQTEIVAVDVGGTNARFARALLTPGKPPRICEVRRTLTAEHPDFLAAWKAGVQAIGVVRPVAAAIAFAGPVVGDKPIQLTNADWRIDRVTLAADLGVDRLVVLNDFAAMAHAVPWLDGAATRHLAGPAHWPKTGMTTVIGPGTGLGVAMACRLADRTVALPCEGGHIAFAPLDAIESAILDQLKHDGDRVSIETVASGPGLARLRGALAAIDGVRVVPLGDRLLWAAAVKGEDALAGRALDRFVLILASAAGDLALAHGSRAVLIVGDLARGIVDQLAAPAFAARFVAKSPHEALMRTIPVRLCLHPDPGLLGAAAAFQAEFLA